MKQIVDSLRLARQEIYRQLDEQLASWLAAGVQLEWLQEHLVVEWSGPTIRDGKIVIGARYRFREVGE